MPASESSTSAQSRREAQREQLRKQRQAELRRQRGTRNLVIALIVILALIIAGGAGYFIWRAAQPEDPPVPPPGVAEEQAYLPVGADEDSDAPVLEIHFDYMCPACGAFEEINGEDVDEIVANDEARVHLVPRRFLDSQSTTGDYSTRAANALVAVWVDDPENVMAFHDQLYANQPTEGGEGLTDEQLWEFAQEAGASDDVQTAIEEGTYSDWVQRVSDPYGEETGGGTPFITVDGTAIELEDWQTPGYLRQTVQSAGGEADPSDGGEG